MTKKVLEDLSKHFLACVPVPQVLECLDCLSPGLFTEQFQEDVLSCTINHPTALRFPPTRAYSKHYLKLLIYKIESSNIDVNEALYLRYTELLTSSTNRSFADDDRGFVTYVLDNNNAVTLRETRALVQNGTTGLKAWQASKFLSEWCLENKELLRGKYILELGCGVGLTGLVVCKLCEPASYTFTDGHQAALTALRDNLKLNDALKPNVHVELMPWEEPSSYHKLDIILGSDLVFDPTMVPALVGAISKLLTRGGVAYIASTIRNPDTHRGFLLELSKASLLWEATPAPQDEVFVYDRSHITDLLKITSVQGT